MFGASLPPLSDPPFFYLRSLYAVSKLSAQSMTVNYWEAYNIYACYGILFNNESPVRGETIVTQKIIKGLINIKRGKQKNLYLGNLYAKRDLGHAEDYVKVMWLMRQQKILKDYVVVLQAKNIQLKNLWI